MIIKKILLFVFLAIPVQILAAGNIVPIIHFTADSNKIDLQPYIEILVDADKALSIEDITTAEGQKNFRPVSVVGNSFGFSSAVFWLRFSLYLDESLEETVLLQLEYPQIDYVTLFVPDGRGGFSERITGDMLPFSSREINHRSLVFQAPEHRGEKRIYYMRLYTGGSMQVALTLWSSSAFIEHVDKTNFFMGGYFGIMLLLLLVAITAWFKLRDRLFLFYALYLFSFQLFLLSLYGFSYQHLWADYPYFASRITAALMGSSIVFALLFCGQFLRVWQGNHPRIKHLFNVLIFSGFVGAVFSLFGDYATVVQVLTLFGLLTPLVIMLAALSSLVKGFKPARYFLAAFSVLLVGVFMAVLLEFGFVPRTFITAHAMQIGALFEIILLGYALMDRIGLLRGEKEVALENASTYLSRLNDGLETKVEKRTKQLTSSEAQLRTLINTLPDMVWWKDPAGIYMGCNQKFESFFGAREADIIGKTDYDFVDNELADFFQEKDRMVVETGVPSLYEEEITFADDGHNEVQETTKVAMHSVDGELMGILGVGRDITQRRKAEQALLNTQKMEAIGQLTGGIAHDFNNILAIIIGNLSMLQRQLPGDDSACQRIAVIQKSAQRAAELVRQLLSFSRNKADKQVVCDINQLLNDMDSLIVHSVTPAIEVSHKFSHDLWLSKIDPGDFQDVMINLIINARDAMSGSGSLILQTSNCTLQAKSCALRPDLKAGDYVKIAVIDHGDGMTQDQQAHIFEPFYTTKEQGKGTGLGLAMVFGFVKRSNGCIIVESEVGVGTNMQLYLPRCTGEPRQKLVIEKDIMEEQHRGVETILVADDEEVLLELAREVLEELGYRVLTVTNGEEALQALAKKPAIDLLLSDVLMPGGINGYELAERATARYPALKVLLASGYTSSSEIHHSQQRFSANMLRKPYNLSELAQRVRQLLDS